MTARERLNKMRADTAAEITKMNAQAEAEIAKIYADADAERRARIMKLSTELDRAIEEINGRDEKIQSALDNDDFEELERLIKEEEEEARKLLSH
jgi:predicted component of viral defense system (DUF524 family)